MNPTLTTFHQRRFEWAFQAMQAFIKDIMGETLPNLKMDVESLDVNELSFNRLKKWLKDAEEARKLELDQVEERIKKQEALIERHTALLEHEMEEAELQYDHICREIDDYEPLLKRLVFKNTESDPIRELVQDIIEYTPHYRRASVLNDDALRLQEIVEGEMEIKLRRINQEADLIGIGGHLEPPSLPPIPTIEQKIDAYWLKGTYEKALSKIRDQAFDWVTQMYLDYNMRLTPLFHEAIKQKEQLVHEAESLKLVNTERRKKLKQELVLYQEEKAELDANYQDVCDLWNQIREHASQLQGYLIKYWMEYKEELQRHFQYGNAEERWLTAQYLQLLRQDGEKIIESLNE